MDDYAAAVFEGHVGRIFEFERADRPPTVDRVRFELIDVHSAHAAGREPAFRQPFTLLFALRGTEQPGPGLLRIAHPEFEPCEWFVNQVVVPGRDVRQAYFQAVFG